MSKNLSRREVMKGGLATLGLASLSLPMWALPSRAQGETVVPFPDFPANFNPNPGVGRRFFDTRKIDNFVTPADEYYTFQRFAQPMVDPATFKHRPIGWSAGSCPGTMSQFATGRLETKLKPWNTPSGRFN